MDPHPLANIFKRSNYDEPISSDLSALDYLYEVLLETRESKNCDEEIDEEIHDSSLNKKAEKEYQTESKRNETFGSVIFWKNMILETWSSRQKILEAATR